MEGGNRGPDRWTLAALRERFTNLRRARGPEDSAPHKPLTLLAALARVQRGDPDARFSDLEPVVRRLLRTFGGARWRAGDPRDPAWYLLHDGVWQVSDQSALRMDRHHPRPLVSSLREVDPVTSFLPEISSALRSHPEWIPVLTHDVLDAYFSPTLHRAIAGSLGLVAQRRRIDRTVLEREAGFRRAVLDAYSGHCALCGLDATLDDDPVAVEAAHVQWHCSDGPSTLDNALALCALHHAAFDLGAVGITAERRVAVSLELRGGAATDEAIRRWNGREYAHPRGASPVAAQFIAWHARHRFRAPALPMG